jgi:uncharacterized membrane protein YidH (DUF202 family)
MDKMKWLIYTVIIGLIPVFFFFIVFLLHKERSFDFLCSEIDFIIFGLVLNSSNINELENKTRVNKKLKTNHIGLSVILIVIFSFLLAPVYFNEIKDIELDKTVFKILAVFLSFVSVLNSYSIHKIITNGKS